METARAPWLDVIPESFSNPALCSIEKRCFQHDIFLFTFANINSSWSKYNRFWASMQVILRFNCIDNLSKVL
jgi:hypothetical protein